jgi:hypothetical protein
LSALQTKAEREISKAQKLISEKDAELLVAEESLSGLVEVLLLNLFAPVLYFVKTKWLGS